MEKNKKIKVLLTGAGGFLGKKIMIMFPELGFEVLGTSLSKDGKISKMDVTNSKEVIEIISGFRPDVVVHAAAAINVDWCEQNRDEAFRINVEGARNVAEACRKAGAKMILISTDYVFDGKKKGKYKEEDERNPVGVYGWTKAEAEKVVEQMLEDFLIVRASVLYGFNDAKDRETYVTYVLRMLKANEEVFGFTDQYNNPAFIDDVVQALTKLIKLDEGGVFHVTGPENISRFEFARKIAKVFGFNQGLVKEGTWVSSEHKAPRAKRLDESIEKLESRGIKMSGIGEGLKKMKKQMDAAS